MIRMASTFHILGSEQGFSCDLCHLGRATALSKPQVVAERLLYGVPSRSMRFFYKSEEATVEWCEFLLLHRLSLKLSHSLLSWEKGIQLEVRASIFDDILVQSGAQLNQLPAWGKLHDFSSFNTEYSSINDKTADNPIYN